jgi:glycosyltransferase involved in cell wall biosynthesis
MSSEAFVPQVLVVHSGARHAYAIPAIFARAGMLDSFHTDVCAGRGLGRVAGLAHALPIPKKAKALSDRILSRRPPSEVLTRTFTDDLKTLLYEYKVRRLTDPSARRRALRQHVAERGARIAARGLGQASHVFNVLGEGGELAKIARGRGIPVLSDIIIALSTARIHYAEFEAFPEWGPPPPDLPQDGFPAPPNLLESTDVFVCPSAFVADDLIANWGVDPATTRVIPYAVSNVWFGISPRPVPGRVLFVGTADRRKGIHYLAMAATALSSTNRIFDFRVAGGIHDAVRSRPESRTLNFLGRVPRNEVISEYATADVFALPTLAEGSATVVYEAMAAGLPVVTTRSAGSVIEDGVDGLIVPERDPDALAAAIHRLVTDRPLRDRIATAAREKAVSAFGWDRWSDALIQLVRNTGSSRGI